jgi:hypothetical protein
MLNQSQLRRLKWIKKEIALLGPHFPTAVISERTGYSNSHISNMLNGKKPCSKKFINSFYAAFEEDLDKARGKEAG